MYISSTRIKQQFISNQGNKFCKDIPYVLVLVPLKLQYDWIWQHSTHQVVPVPGTYHITWYWYHKNQYYGTVQYYHISSSCTITPHTITNYNQSQTCVSVTLPLYCHWETLQTKPQVSAIEYSIPCSNAMTHLFILFYLYCLQFDCVNRYLLMQFHLLKLLLMQL